MSVPEKRGVAALPAIIKMAESYELDAAAFVYTFKTMAMPANSSDAEFLACCLVAREHGLNPLTKEIYFMKTKAGTIQPIVSVDGWIKKCNQHPQFDGMDVDDDRDANGKLTGMFCTIYRKDRGHPTRIREDLAECKAAGGPVWKTSEYRMMRNRVICQSARIAFGFAGIMEPDEFEAWQRGMKDITPKTTAPPDIPDDIPSEAEQSQDPPEAVVSAATAPATIDRPDQVLLDLREALVLAKTAKDRAEVSENFEDRIESLPPAFQSAARKMLKELE